MRKEEVVFQSEDQKHQIYATRWVPDGNVIGVVQIVHGMAEYIDRYDDFARFLAEHGYVVTGDDHLGHGRTGEKQGAQGYFCPGDSATVLVEDEHSLRMLTQKDYPEVPYYFFGHSMGSFITRNYICAHGEGLAGTIISGTGMQPAFILGAGRGLVGFLKLFHKDSYVSKMVDQIAFGDYNKRFSPQRTAFDWLSKNEENVDKYIADPLCGITFSLNGFATLFELIHRLYDSARLDKVPKNLPLLYLSGEDDPVGNYGEGVKTAFDSLKKMGVSDMKMKLYPTLRHEILNEEEHMEVYEDVFRFLETNK